MKEFIKKLKKLNRTKKLVILFITISFVFILGITFYNSVTNHFEIDKEVVTIQEKDEKDIGNKDSNRTKDESEKNEDQNENEEQNTSVINKNDTPTNKNQTNDSKSVNNQDNTVSNTQNQNSNSSNNDDSQSNDSHQSTIPSKPSTETISVDVQVIGMGNTIMRGNLTVEKGANAYSVLKELSAQKGIKVSTSGFGSMVYVRGIGDLFEKQHGNLSGWMYKVNGKNLNMGAGNYTLNNGDQVVWYYVNYE